MRRRASRGFDSRSIPLIDERNWRGDADLAETYVNWGGYAYTAVASGVDARANSGHDGSQRAVPQGSQNSA